MMPEAIYVDNTILSVFYTSSFLFFRKLRNDNPLIIRGATVRCIVACLQPGGVMDTLNIPTGKKSVKKFQDVADLLSDGFFTIKNGRITYANRKGGEILGYEPDALISRQVAEFAVEGDRASVSDILDKAESEGRHPEPIQFGIKRIDGTIRYVLFKMSSESIDGEWFVLLSDITDRKRIEDDLEEINIRYRDFAEMLPQTIFEADLQGQLVFANEMGFASFGYTREEFDRGLQITDMVIPEDRARATANAARIIAGSESKGAVYAALRKDGSTFPAEFYSTAIERNGTVIGFRGIIIDASERMRHEDELSKARALLFAAAEVVPSGIVVMSSPERKTLIVNSTAEDILNTTSEKIQTGFVSEFVLDWKGYYADGSACPPDEMPLERTLRGDYIRNLELRIVRGDESERWILLNGAPVFGVKGELIGAVVIFSDITEIRNMEGEMFRHQRLEAVGILAAGIAHDFNNLLTAIIGNINLLKFEEGLTDEANELIHDCETAGIRAKDLTSQLLAFARSGDPVMKLASIDLLVKETATFAVKGTGVKPVVSIHSPVWSAEIDPAQISQVIQNLVMSAAHAMRSGEEIMIRIENCRITNSESTPGIGSYVCINITDPRVMTEEEQLRIFEPYYATMSYGSGLGMSIAYSIIKRHGGAIIVHSIPGTGTVFEIYIPAVENANGDS
jgi:PAS domain S-box-containing protein